MENITKPYITFKILINQLQENIMKDSLKNSLEQINLEDEIIKKKRKKLHDKIWNKRLILREIKQIPKSNENSELVSVVRKNLYPRNISTEHKGYLKQSFNNSIKVRFINKIEY